ncbi:hypothetical protein KM043_011409 [Ampulex compressa]|nr:hypothetical protein KM043_011409 [Ampulex compressa]
MYGFLLTFLLIEACRGFTGRGLYYPGRSDLFELSLIHLNDFHARFQETGPTSGTCHQKYDCVGGIARVYTAVNRLKEERPNAVFLNAGDHFQGTLWYNVHRWNVTATFMNMLPHDAMTIGNHEFDNKIDGLVPFLKMIKAPVVLANIDDSEEPRIQGLYKNSTIIDRNGTKIGVIGIILSTTNTIANTEKLRFLDEVETVNSEAQKLRSQGIDIIVVLSHAGLDIDRIMAARCPLVDVIVGGHSHSFLYSGPPPFIDHPVDEYPVVVTQEGTNRTVLIVQAAAYTKYLGNLTVWFDNEGEVIDWDGNPILLDYSVEEDPGILQALQPWQVDVDNVALTKVAQTKVFLDHRCRKRECNFGNLVTDAMVDTYVEKAENRTYWTYASVACINPGGLRSSIQKNPPDITYADVAIAQPFENTWDTIELNGTAIKQILQVEGILVWSGLKVTYKIEGETRHVIDVKIRCRDCDIPKFEDVVDEKWYRIAVVSFLVTGGDGYTIFKTHSRNHEIGTLDIDHLVKYMKKMSPITAGIDGRVTFL